MKERLGLAIEDSHLLSVQILGGHHKRITAGAAAKFCQPFNIRQPIAMVISETYPLRDPHSCGDQSIEKLARPCNGTEGYRAL